MWHDVAQWEGRGELFVANSQQAERLRMALLASPTTAWQASVRAVVIQVERGGGLAMGSKRIGDLLLALPRLERLYLELQDSLVGSQNSPHPFGESLYLALQGATALTHVHLERGAEAAQVDIRAMYSMLRCWPILRSFTAPSLGSALWIGPRSLPSDANLRSTLPTRLQSISIENWLTAERASNQIPTDSCTNYNVYLLLRLLARSSSTIQALSLGPFHEEVLSLRAVANLQTVSAVLSEVAPRLRHLDMRDGPSPTPATSTRRSDYLVHIIEQLASIRTLTLGLGGVPSADLFPLVARLTTLVDLSFDSSVQSPSPNDYKLNSQAVATFLAGLRKLGTLKLPSSHCAHWNAEERRAVEVAAEAADVWLRFD